MGFASYWVGEMIDLSLMVHFDYTILKWTILNDWEKYTDKGLLQNPAHWYFRNCRKTGNLSKHKELVFETCSFKRDAAKHFKSTKILLAHSGLFWKLNNPKRYKYICSAEARKKSDWGLSYSYKFFILNCKRK